MRIALVGYGKMGRIIGEIAKKRGHEISKIIDKDNLSDLKTITPENTDVAIEFSRPDSAYLNISTCIENGVRVISGTTGWLDKYPDIVEKVSAVNGTFLYASNFSLGVNLFFKINSVVSRFMADFDDYTPEVEEIHHTEKLDKPSGTAITIAEGFLTQQQRRSGWVNQKTTDQTKLGIISERLPNVPGTHSVTYSSEEDSIEIKHTANSRQGFAFGAVKVAEWIQEKQGVLTMDDFLNLSI